MQYYLKYRCEFDTIKDRQVRIDIELGRNIDPHVGGALVKEYSIQFAPGDIFGRDYNAVEFVDSKRDFLVGDIIEVTDTSLNDGSYTITEVFEYEDIIYEGIQTFRYYLIVDGTFEVETSDFGILTFIPEIASQDPINLTASTQSPLILEYPNGKFEKMCPIRESKLRFKILSDNVSYEDFTIEFDTQYKIKLYIAPKYDPITNEYVQISENNLEWLGWLDNDYITQPYLDIPSEIELSGSDGLSTLKTRKLVDFEGKEVWDVGVGLPFPNSFVNLKWVISYCLYQTGLNLDYTAAINIFPEGGSIRDVGFPETWDDDAFGQSNVTSTTFAKGTRDYDDCYEVLSKIMQAFGCTLFQSKGKWYIIHTFDKIRGTLGATERDFEGSVISATDDLNPAVIEIGLNESVKLINADALISIEKAFDEVVCKFDFEEPTLYFRNFDLLDLEPIPDTIRDAPKYWREAPSYLSNQFNYFFGVRDGFVGSSVVVEIDPSTGSEIQRYIQLFGRRFFENPGGVGAGAAATTEYPVNEGDKIKFGFSTRYTVDDFGNGITICYLILRNANNEYYHLYNDGSWRIQPGAIGPAWSAQDPPGDRLLWREYNIDSTIPETGWIQIVLTGSSSGGGVQSQEYYAQIKDLSFEIKPAVSIGTASGYEHKSKNKKQNKNKFDVEMFMSNSENIAVKGSLTGFDGIIPVSLKNWGFNFLGTLGQVQAFAKHINQAYWAAMFRNFIKLEGRLFNIYINDSNLISPLNNIIFDQFSDKKFMLTTVQIDIRQESAEFTSIELVDENLDYEELEAGNIYKSYLNVIESFRYLDFKAKDYNNPAKEPKSVLDWKFGAFSVINGVIRRNQVRRYNSYL
jgi:hypothetical protein